MVQAITSGSRKKSIVGFSNLALAKGFVAMDAGVRAYDLDRFAILNNCLVVDGWAENANPKILYDGKEIMAISKAVKRPDLAENWGPQAEDWGFTLCALLPSRPVNLDLFAIEFSSSVTIDKPCAKFSAPSDTAFFAMRANFLNSVNTERGRILEVGSRDRSGNSYRDLFPDAREYVGVDVTDGPGVDVVADAHELSRHVTGTFDFAFSIAVFEHLIMPWKVALELNKVLRTGGRAMIVSHAGWPLHEEPWDFLRFSKEAWQGLFNAHTGFRLLDAQYEFPARVVPDYTHDGNMARMSDGKTYLLSGCLVERVGPATVEWSDDVWKIYDLNYSHA